VTPTEWSFHAEVVLGYPEERRAVRRDVRAYAFQTTLQNTRDLVLR